MPVFGRNKIKQKTPILYQYNDIKKYVKNGFLEIPENYEKIGDWAFSDCNKLQKVIIGENINSIGNYSFSGCHFLKEIHIPNSIEYIGYYCFVDCKRLEKFVTPINKNVRVARVFSETIDKLNWLYKVKGDDRFVFSFSKPTVDENVESIINLNDLNSVFKYKQIGYVCDDLFETEKFNDVIKLVSGLKKNNIDVHNGFIDGIVGTEKFKIFADADFSYYKNEFSSILKEVDKMLSSEKNDFYRFLMAFGCFSNKKILDANGKETDVLLSHKACSLLSSLIKKGHLTIDNITRISVSDFINYPNPNQDFLKYISEQGPNKTHPNLELILKLEKKYSGIFAHTMTEFDKAKKLRNYFDKDGNPAKRSWEEALILFYKKNKYLNINDDNKLIAERFAEFRLDQDTFDKAIEQYRIAKNRRTPHNILKKEIQERTALEEIERIKQETQNQLSYGKTLIENLYKKEFTFEMLDKYDPDNAIIGLFCSCCAQINSELYGGEIARATITAPDVQNLVVRDNKGDIVGKGAMYVNHKFGYAVINDFEINEKYKKDEIQNNGRYKNDDLKTKISKQRKQIFDTLIRGIKAFAKQYDIEHPTSPLKKVNVGMGYNRLKKLCEEFEKETDKLHVPVEYGFVDATDDQYILYDRAKEISNVEKSLEK